MGRGVVSLLDQKHSALVENLWTELEGEFGLQGLSGRIIPHLSFHVADSYDQRCLKRALKEFASGQTDLHIETAGLGIFTGPAPTLYVAVERCPALSKFHEDLWAAISDASQNPSRYYSPENWSPHISLASWTYMSPDLRERLPDIVAFLIHRPLNWQIGLDNLTLLRSSDETGGSQETVFAVALAEAQTHGWTSYEA
ncbi:MAG: 2'-5' RNA ligase family protein [Dehalococcoidia bacterium]|nr:2'-5' RNA ligase family protein [Dehalococcoidia bacterium]